MLALPSRRPRWGPCLSVSALASQTQDISDAHQAAAPPHPAVLPTCLCLRSGLQPVQRERTVSPLLCGAAPLSAFFVLPRVSLHKNVLDAKDAQYGKARCQYVSINTVGRRNSHSWGPKKTKPSGPSALSPITQQEVQLHVMPTIEPSLGPYHLPRGSKLCTPPGDDRQNPRSPGAFSHHEPLAGELRY